LTNEELLANAGFVAAEYRVVQPPQDPAQMLSVDSARFALEIAIRTGE